MLRPCTATGAVALGVDRVPERAIGPSMVAASGRDGGCIPVTGRALTAGTGVLGAGIGVAAGERTVLSSQLGDSAPRSDSGAAGVCSVEVASSHPLAGG